LITVVVSPPTEIWSPTSKTLTEPTLMVVAPAAWLADSVVPDAGPFARPGHVQVQ
jgi:hypothetical protein